MVSKHSLAVHHPNALDTTRHRFRIVFAGPPAAVSDLLNEGVATFLRFLWREAENNNGTVTAAEADRAIQAAHGRNARTIIEAALSTTAPKDLAFLRVICAGSRPLRSQGNLGERLNAKTNLVANYRSRLLAAGLVETSWPRQARFRDSGPSPAPTQLERRLGSTDRNRGRALTVCSGCAACSGPDFMPCWPVLHGTPVLALACFYSLVSSTDSTWRAASRCSSTTFTALRAVPCCSASFASVSRSSATSSLSWSWTSSSRR